MLRISLALEPLLESIPAMTLSMAFFRRLFNRADQANQTIKALTLRNAFR
jgi:hypothetical protein